MFIYWESKFHVSPKAVQVRMPSALNSWRFIYLSVLLCLTGTHRCPASSARGVQRFGGKYKNKNMKTRNGVTVTYDAFT